MLRKIFQFNLLNKLQKSLTHAASIQLQKPLNIKINNNVLDIKPNNNLKSMKFPIVWLRDNCQCSECFHKSSNSRIINWENFNVKVNIENITANDNGDLIEINWSDKHKSEYQLNWLKDRDFCNERQKKYLETFYRPKQNLWGKHDFNKVLLKLEYKDVMENDLALKAWLNALAVNGVVLIENSPLEKNVARNLSDRVGFIRKTSYGEEFIVESKPDAKNYAYLSKPLFIHTDLPYYEYKPGINILHTLVQSNSSGGSNSLADGFYIANKMKTELPENFKILQNTLIDWNDINDGDEKFHFIFRSPVICTDIKGNLTRINHSIPQRDTYLNIDIDQVYGWYEAYSKFVKMLQTEAVEFKTKPGDVLTFNNIRLVHGRTGYDDSENNVRCVIGAYVDWDTIYSKLRVLSSG